MTANLSCAQSRGAKKTYGSGIQVLFGVVSIAGFNRRTSSRSNGIGRLTGSGLMLDRPIGDRLRTFAPIVRVSNEHRAEGVRKRMQERALKLNGEVVETQSFPKRTGGTDDFWRPQVEPSAASLSFAKHVEF
jgi:hypothetical protein